MDMECLEVEIGDPFLPLSEQGGDDICSLILSKVGNSEKEEHQQLCKVIGAMAQELTDQNHSLSPLSYFGATAAALDRLSSDHSASNDTVSAFVTILSLVMPRVSVGILKRQRQFLSELLVWVFQSKALWPSATVSGLNCISRLLMARDSVNWADISPLYGFLANFITDSQPKVRRQSHLCIRDVLQSFQGSSLLAPASEGFTNVLGRAILFAGGSNDSLSDSAKAAQQILYILEALKVCLPYLSRKHNTQILKYFNTLLQLHQRDVMRIITDSLNALCLHPTMDVSPEALVDLLCSFALSTSGDWATADGLTFTGRLLDVGMRKVYALNKEICIVKLPVIFNALKDILGVEHQEALFAAAEAMKSLILVCLDEDMVQNGVNQVKLNGDLITRKSALTVVEKICVAIGSLLDNRYMESWDLVFQVVSLMFDKLGEHSFDLLGGILKSLADIQQYEGLHCRKQLHECLGSALRAMGPENFLSLLPLNLEAEKLSEANVWLFPILKRYTIGASLNFYFESLLRMIGHLKQRSRKLEVEGFTVSSRTVDSLVYSLWSLLPSFCNYPSDTAAAFNLLEKPLCDALSEEPDLHGIVCSSLQILIQQNKRILEGVSNETTDELSMSTKRAVACYDQQVASNNLQALRSSAHEFLSVLSKVFLRSGSDSGGSLQATIAEFTSISDKVLVTKFFKTAMQKLLKVTQGASKAEDNSSSIQIGSSNENSLSLVRAQLFDLAVSLLPGLGTEEIDLLFVATVPALKDGEGFVQKKAYKVLSIIFKSCDGFISRKHRELLELMIEVLPLCHFSAKRYRLDCLYYLILHVLKDDSELRRSDIISSFLTEIILALKEANKKSRNRAYDILVQIGHACGDEETGGTKENLLQFFNMVAGGLAGETPHMISAAVKGLARLAYEFSELVFTAYNVLPSSLLLLQRKNREIIKANLGLLKVLIAKSDSDGLQTHLKSMVEGLLKWQDDTMNHFKAKVKYLLDMLVKKCGLDAVRAVVPEEQMKLLTNIRKIRERRERKLASNSEAGSYQSKATTSRHSQWNHTKIFSDFSEEEASDGDYMDSEKVPGRRSTMSSRLKSKASSLRLRRAALSERSLPEDLLDQLDEEPLNLLDQRKTRSALQSTGHLKRKSDTDHEPEFDSEGRLIIREEGKGKKSKREKAPGFESDDRSEAGSYLSMNSKTKAQKRRKTSESGWAYIGNEYTSKKACGDVKRKGKLEPYAYWPLDRKMLSRRPEHKAAAKKGMASVVRLTKKLEGKSTASLLNMKAMKIKKGHRKAK